MLSRLRPRPERAPGPRGSQGVQCPRPLDRELDGNRQSVQLERIGNGMFFYRKSYID